MKTNIDEFKSELKALMDRYKAGISCNVKGDTHGLSYEMVILFGQSDKWKEHKICDGNGFESSDI